MSKSGSTFTYNDPFKQAGTEKAKTQKAIRNDFGFGSFFSADPAAQPLFVSDLSIDAFLELLPLFSGISDLSDTPKLTTFKNAFDAVTASEDLVLFGTVKGLFDEALPTENLAYVLSRTLANDTIASEFAQLNLGKSLVDSYGVNDTSTLSQLKLLKDSSSTDSFNKFFVAKNIFNSVTATQDFFDRNVIYNREFNNQALAESNLALLYTKNLEDDTTVDQFFTVDFDKFAEDEVIISQQVSFVTSKLLTDFVNVADLIGIPDGLLYQFNTPEQAVAAVDDQFTRLANYKRTFNEDLEFEAPEEIQPFGLFSFSTFSEPQEEESAALSTDILTIDFGLVKSNSADSESFNSLFVTKPFVEQANPDQLISLRPSKTIIESLTSTDDDTLTIGKNVFNNVDISQLIAFDVSKSIDESVEPTQFIALTSNLFKEDNSVSEDQILLAFATSFANDSEATDDSVILTGKGLTETILTPDDQTFSVSKFLDDSVVTEDLVSIPDGVTYASTKSVFDSVTATQDFFTRTLIANRLIESIVDTINDGQTLFTTKGLAHNTVLLDDQSFDVNKVLRNSSNAVEQIALDLDKPLEDSFDAEQRIFLSPNLFKEDTIDNISDFSNIDYTKVQKDSQGLSDDLSISFEKVFRNSVGVVDVFTLGDGLTYRFDNPESDAVGVSELFKRVLQYGRAFDDNTLSTDESTLAPTLNKTDSVAPSQRISLNFSTKFVNSTLVEENVALNPVLIKADEVSNLSDTDTLNITLGRFENITTSQFLAFVVEKELAHSSNVAEEISLAVSLGTISDSTDETTDDDTIQFTKGLTEDISNEDVQFFDIAKLIKDSVNTEDLVSVPDGATYYATKSLSNFATATEVFEILLTATRLFEEFQQATDQSTLTFGKNETEELFAPDSQTFDVFKPIDNEAIINQNISLDFSTSFSEERTIADAPQLNPILYKDDLVGTDDDFTISFRVRRAFSHSVISQESLSFSSSILKANSADADERIALSSQKIFENSVDGIDDAPSLAPNLGKTDSSEASDTDPVFDISKLLKDDADIDDLVSVPDGSTYYATKNLRHAAEPLDDFTKTLQYNRSFANDTFTSSSLEFFSLSKVVSNSASVSQNTTFDISKSILDDEVTQSVFVSLSADKFLDDSTGQLDAQSLTFEKVVGVDSSTPNDVFEFNVIFNRTFENEAQPDSNTVFAVSLVKANSSDAVERIFLSTDKQLQNSVDNISEAARLNTGLLKTETVLPEQNIAFDISKLLKDDADIDDLVSVPDGSTYYATKLLRHASVASDLFSKLLTYNRFFDNFVTLSDDTLSFGIGKLLENSSTASDDDVLSVSKSILDDEAVPSIFVSVGFGKAETDTVENIGDTQALNVDLFKEDSAVATELLSYLLVYRRTFENSVSSSQFVSLDTALVKDDSALAEQFIALEATKPFTNEVNDLSDIQTLQSGLVKQDDASATESSAFDISKLLKDDADIDDLVSVPDGSTYYITKLLRHSASTSDLFNRFLTYNRFFEDDYSTSDDQFFTVSKLLEDTAGATTEFVKFDTTLVKTDTVSDPDVFVARQFGKSLSDTFSAGDRPLLSSSLEKVNEANASDLFNKVLTYNRFFDNSVSQSDTDVISFGKGLSDLATGLDDQSFDVSKLIRDNATIDDAISLDGSTYTLSKQIANFINNISDDQSFDVSKFVDDSITLDDTISLDGSVYELSKLIDDDSADVLDDQIFDVSKFFENFASANQFIALQPTKSLAHDANASDDSVFFVDKLLSDEVLQDDPLAIRVDKQPIEDVVLPSDPIVLSPEKFVENDYSVSDFNTTQFTKGINNQVNNSDDQLFDISKLLKDSSTIDDLVGVPDGSQYYASKKLVDTSFATDVYAYVWDAIRNFNHSSDAFDFSRIQTTINKQETLNTNDSDIFNVGLFKSNATAANEDMVFRFDKGDITNNVVSLEDARLNFAFGTIENSVSGQESVALQPSLSEQDDASATASGLLVAQNYTVDAFYWAEDYVGESRIV